MSAEWQMRHCELAMSAPTPAGNGVRLVGSCTLTLVHRTSDCLGTCSCELDAFSARSCEATPNNQKTPPPRPRRSPASATGAAQITADLRSLDSTNTPSDAHDTCTAIDSITLRMKPAPFQLG